MSNLYAERVNTIRELMLKNGWDAVIISGSDPHSSEYVAARWHQIAWISGYSGEGDIVITANHAGLWTDTRYFIQAGKQLPGTGIELHKTRIPEQILIPEWLANHAFPEKNNVVIAVDGLCQTISSMDDIRDAFRTRACIVNVPDMLNDFWSDRPAIPCTPISLLDAALTGFARQEKIAWLRSEFKTCSAIFISALDEIAWLLNVRGSDVDYNPVVMSYLIVSKDAVIWFVKKPGEPAQSTKAVFEELENEGIQIRNYDDAADGLCQFMKSTDKLFIDPSSLNYSLYEALKPDTDKLITGKSPIILKKAIKTNVEVEGMRKAHEADGLAVVKFLHWLEKTIQSGTILSEWDAAVQLGKFRSECPDYRGDSFETVSSWGEGAALPHYVTPQDGSTKIGNHGLFLCDSGGQYLYGTTDITRTVPLGECTQLEKEDYTLVLKGHIDLAMATFPKGTSGSQLDVLAREPLWKTYRNFGHGTGHGVGFFLNVHEGPQDIRQGFNKQPMLPGMITSNEPGVYREGMHGVRHENLILCIDTGIQDFGRDWLAFENLTICHFDTTPIIREWLNNDEVQWLNAYNEMVYQKLSMKLDKDTAEWLRKKTMPI